MNRMNKYEILLIEDDEDIARIIQTVFYIRNHHLVVAPTGNDGLSMMNDKKYDLLLLDIGFPDITGFDVLKRIKDTTVNRNIPVVIISALNKKKDIHSGFELGAFGYIRKPFDPAALGPEIEELLSELTVNAVYMESGTVLSQTIN